MLTLLFADWVNTTTILKTKSSAMNACREDPAWLLLYLPHRRVCKDSIIYMCVCSCDVHAATWRFWPYLILLWFISGRILGDRATKMLYRREQWCYLELRVWVRLRSFYIYQSNAVLRHPLSISLDDGIYSESKIRNASRSSSCSQIDERFFRV